MLLEKCIINLDRILLSLAALVISEGKLGDLTARAGEELKMQGAPFAVSSVHVRAVILAVGGGAPRV